ncbi:hypothetical protein D3C76_1585780 [compost metagenome]
MAVLLEELPLQHLRAQARLGRQEVTAVGKEVEDGVGLPQVRAVFQLQHRHLAIGVHRQELGGLGLPLENIHRVPLIRPTQQAQHQLDLVAVARLVVPIDLVHRPPLPCSCAFVPNSWRLYG